MHTHVAYSSHAPLVTFETKPILLTVYDSNEPQRAPLLLRVGELMSAYQTLT